MEKILCDVCTKDNPKFILNCGCSLCSNCYEVVKSFIEGDSQKCYVCDKDIILSMTIDVSKKIIYWIKLQNLIQKKIMKLFYLN